MGISRERDRESAPTGSLLEYRSSRDGTARSFDIEGTRGDEWQRWPAARREEFIGAAVRYWRKRGFPYYKLTDEQIDREIGYLRAYDPRRVFRGNEIVSNSLGLRLVNSFHPQMWHVRCTRYYSPFETFSDDLALVRAIRKALQIWPDRYGANGSSLRRMLKSFSNTAAVSNFRPTAAMGIIDRYSPLRGRVLDFAAGYGGRLAAAIVTKRNYVGIDAGVEQARGLVKLARQCGMSGVSGPVRIHRGASEDIMPGLKSATFDLVFSSPPYFHREKYGNEPEQSFRRYASAGEWRERFLRPVIEHSARVLRRGGYLVLNANEGADGIASAVREIASRNFEIETEWKMRLAMLPYKRSGPAEAYKWEPVMAFRKRSG